MLCGSCIQAKKQFKVQIIGILEEIDSFYWPKLHLRQVWEKIGQGPPPPHLDKIQKNSSIFLGCFRGRRPTRSMKKVLFSCLITFILWTAPLKKMILNSNTSISNITKCIQNPKTSTLGSQGLRDQKNICREFWNKNVAKCQ